MSNERDDLIKSEEHFRKVQEESKGPEVQEEVHKFNHLAVLDQTLKIIDIMPMDKFVKEVLCKKLISPLLNKGIARTNMSIALELGATVADVDQAEAFGVAEIERFLQSNDLQEAINKFNTDGAVENAVKNMGNPN